MNSRIALISILFAGITIWNLVELVNYNDRINELASSAFFDLSDVDFSFTDSLNRNGDNDPNELSLATSPRALFIVNAAKCNSHYEDIKTLSNALDKMGVTSQLLIWSDNPLVGYRAVKLAENYLSMPVLALNEVPTGPIATQPDLGAVLVLKQDSGYSDMVRIVSAETSERIRTKILYTLLETINQNQEPS